MDRILLSSGFMMLSKNGIDPSGCVSYVNLIALSMEFMCCRKLSLGSIGVIHIPSPKSGWVLCCS